MAPAKLRRNSPGCQIELRPAGRCRVPEGGVARGKGEERRLSLTCRRSFHRAAPRDAETVGPRVAPPIAEPSPAVSSVSPNSESAIRDSISTEPSSSRDATETALPCQDLPTSFLSGPVTPALLPTVFAPSPNSAFPVFSSPWQPSHRSLASLHHLSGGHLE